MPLKHSQSKSKRQRLEEAGAGLRSVFSKVPVKSRVEKADASVILSQAWDLADQITDFAVKYLRHFMVDPETDRFIAPAVFHRELYTILLTERYAAIAAPREHAKSTVVSVIFPLYCICYKLRRFIVLIGDNQANAALQLAAIKEELETNAKLREDFGDLVGDKKWDVNDCRTNTGISIVARGAGQSMRGLRYRQYRPDLIILDDLENEESVDNPETREKLIKWFKGTVMSLGKNAQIFAVGTILHFDSFLSNLLDPEKFKRFIKRTYEAVDDEWTPDSVLWPEKWDLQSLKEKEGDVGSVFFNQEFRNRPISADTQVFQEGWIIRHAYRREELQQKPCVRVTYYDPAISLKKRADFFASVTLAIDTNGFLHVERAEGVKLPYIKQKEFILNRYDEEQPVVVGIENQAYQDALKQEMEEQSRVTGRYINVVGVPNLTDKFLRISSISSLVENGTIRFCLDGTQKTLIQQLLFLGKIKDDQADALQGAVQLARTINFQVAIASSNAQVGGRESGVGRGEVLAGQSRGGDDFVRRDRRSRWA
jgi:predicted phage terminase large subunit-like protein